MKNANETQVGGEHYKSSYAPWDFVLDVFAGDFFLGNVSKYLVRHRHKNGLEDLYKAQHYLQKYLQLLAEGRATQILPQSPVATAVLVAHFARANEVPPREEDILTDLAAGAYGTALRALETLILREEHHGSLHPGND